MTGALEALAQLWRDEAAVLRRCGHESTATLSETHAAELEAAWLAHRLELLTVGEAAEESGYSTSCLYAALRDGTVENAGRRGAPRIRRADLPKRLGRRPQGLIPLERAIIVADLDNT